MGGEKAEEKATLTDALIALGFTDRVNPVIAVKVAVNGVLDPILKSFPIEIFDPLTQEQEDALQAWFKKLRGALI